MQFRAEGALTRSKQAQCATDEARDATINAKRKAEALEARLHRLKQEYDYCKAELSDARATEEVAYTNYMQTISRNFAAAFLFALPRELRDHVYSYLWDDEDIIRQTKRCVREYAWSYRMPEFCAPAYVQPDHVGRIVADELALSIYKRAFGTKLHVTVSAGHIHKFLAANPLRSSLKPADCIRALDIEWYPNEFSDQDVARSFQDLADYCFPSPVPIKLILGKLLVATERSAASTAVLERQLGAFKAAYDALKMKDCRVTVESLSGNGAEVDLLTNM